MEIIGLVAVLLGIPVTISSVFTFLLRTRVKGFSDVNRARLFALSGPAAQLLFAAWLVISVRTEKCAPEDVCDGLATAGAIVTLVILSVAVTYPLSLISTQAILGVPSAAKRKAQAHR